MRKRNTTPFRFAAIATSRKPPQPEASVVVRGRFALAAGVLAPHAEQGRLSAELFDEDDADCAGGCTKPSDLAHFKLRADVVLTGVCHAPGGKPTGESFVRLAVKSADGKSLVSIDRRVFGARVWTEKLLGKAFTDPLPFTTMPLGWAESFGGDGYAENPVGKGIGTHELPNVEWAQSISAKGDRPKPACPGPINPVWPSRREKVGKAYDGDYAKTRAPYFAADFDWAHFQAVAREQQIEGYLRGDETLELVNLHPSLPSLECKLPGLRVRVFLRDVAGKFREVSLALDTLHVDSAEGFVDLAWRGVDPVGEADLSDLAFAIITSEPLAERPKPASHYEAQMKDFVDDPLGIREAIPDALRPTYERAQKLAEQRSELEAAPKGDASDPLTAEIERAAGLLEPEQAAALREAVAKMREAAQKLHEDAAARAKEAGKEPPPPLDEAIAKAVAAARAPQKSPVDFDPEGKPRISLGATVSAQKELLEKIRSQSDLPPEARAKLDEAGAKLDDARLADLDPTLRGGAPLCEPGPSRDLRRRDLRSYDLAGADLSGCDLRGAMLSKAKLAGAKLAGALFEHAQLDRVDLRGADLSGAKLDGGIFFDADLSGANLTGATLSQAILAHAKLDDANLERATGVLVLLNKASMRRVKARGLDLCQSALGDADLTGADLSGASLLRCLLRGAKAHGAIFEGARLGHASFESADLTEARFTRATGPFASFMRALLDKTDLTHTVLTEAHFSEAQGTATRFDAANLPDARFYRAKLERATFVRANLIRADFGLARIPGTSFEGASLFDAKLIRTAGEGCNFLGANLTRSTLEGA